MGAGAGGEVGRGGRGEAGVMGGAGGQGAVVEGGVVGGGGGVCGRGEEARGLGWVGGWEADVTGRWVEGQGYGGPVLRGKCWVVLAGREC